MECMSDSTGVSIGKAAALYDLAPSTLRWWESQRVLPKARRVNGRRVYSETDLRRIGLAYLCSVTGVMSLEQVSAVTVGRRNERWHEAVSGQVQVLQKKIEDLQDARTYLMHLLSCPDDDIVDECPMLDSELMEHTPRGQVSAASFVAAAQSSKRHSNIAAERDETSAERDETSANDRCPVCAGAIEQPATGRRRRYCSRACQQKHYRETAQLRASRH